MLDEEFLSDTTFTSGFEKLTNTVELMVARPNDALYCLLFFFASLLVLYFFLLKSDLGVVLQDVRERTFTKNILPQVSRAHSIWANRIPSTAIHAFVEWQEP